MNEWNNVDMRYRLKHCQWHPNKWRWRWRPLPHPQHSQTSLWDTEEKEKNARQNALWTFQSIRILPCTHTIRSCWTKMEWNEQVNERGANWNWNLGLVDWLYTFICFALFCCGFECISHTKDKNMDTKYTTTFVPYNFHKNIRFIRSAINQKLENQLYFSFSQSRKCRSGSNNQIGWIDTSQRLTFMGRKTIS